MQTSILRWQDVWSDIATSAEASIHLHAADRHIDPSDLEKLVLLHLPRFSLDELSSSEVLEDEIRRLAERIAGLQDGLQSWTNRPAIAVLLKHQFTVQPVPEAIAHCIHERFHYLGSVRDGLHFGLYHEEQPDLPAGLATVSPLDVEHLRARMSTDVRQEDGFILSRVFAFPWAPRNSISALLGGLGKQMCAKNAHPIVLFTYVNLNLGFTATSYRAANWRQDGTKTVTYRYLNGNYVTARQAALRTPAEIQYSQYALEPLQIWRWDSEL